MYSDILIPTYSELLRIPAEYLMYIIAEGNFSKVYTLDGTYRMVSFQLGQLEDMIGMQMSEEDSPFVRVGKSLIVNKSKIYVIDLTEQQIIMSDYQGHFHKLSASKKALVTLKFLIENDKP